MRDQVGHWQPDRIDFQPEVVEYAVFLVQRETRKIIAVRGPVDRARLLAEGGVEAECRDHLAHRHAVFAIGISEKRRLFAKLRLEARNPLYGHELTEETSPFQAGLGFAVKFDKGDFLGREALIKQKQEGLKRKLVIFTIEDPEPLIYHYEPVYRNGERVSYITHGAYAHQLGCAIGMGYLKNRDGITDEWILKGDYEIGWQGKRVPAKVHLKAPYDPQGERVRM